MHRIFSVLSSKQTLAGGGQRLKGYTIGVEVFGRPADFDAQSDALVRVEAGRLRRRLVEYYASEGSGNRLRIELPRGSYAADYRFAGDDQGAALPRPIAKAAPRPAPTSNGFPWRGTALALTVLLVAAIGVIGWQQMRRARSGARRRGR